jgi:hypothetical protein
VSCARAASSGPAATSTASSAPNGTPQRRNVPALSVTAVAPLRVTASRRPVRPTVVQEAVARAPATRASVRASRTSPKIAPAESDGGAPGHRRVHSVRRDGVAATTDAVPPAGTSARTPTPSSPAASSAGWDTLIVRRPGGTLSSANRPRLSATVLRAVPSTNTAAPASGRPRRLSTTVPRTTPSGPVPSGAGAWARAAAATQDSTAAPTARHIRWRACADTGRGMRAAGCEARAEVRVGPDAPARSGTHPVAARRPLAP